MTNIALQGRGGVVRTPSTPQVYFWCLAFVFGAQCCFIVAWVVVVGGLLGVVLFCLVGFRFLVIFVGCNFCLWWRVILVLGRLGVVQWEFVAKYSQPWHTIVCHDWREGLPPKISFWLTFPWGHQPQGTTNLNSCETLSRVFFRSLTPTNSRSHQSGHAQT